MVVGYGDHAVVREPPVADLGEQHDVVVGGNLLLAPCHPLHQCGTSLTLPTDGHAEWSDDGGL